MAPAVVSSVDEIVARPFVIVTFRTFPLIVTVPDPLVEPGKLGSKLRSQRCGASYSDYWQMRCTTREKATPEFSSANSWGFRTVRRLRPLPQR